MDAGWWVQFSGCACLNRADALESQCEQAHIEAMPRTRPPRPRDPNQLAKLIVDIATGEASDPAPAPGKAPGRAIGGKAGGRARADKLSPELRTEIAKKAADKRWSKT